MPAPVWNALFPDGPNGLILCYPVITSGEYAHRGSVETLLGPQQLDNEEMVPHFWKENGTKLEK